MQPSRLQAVVLSHTALAPSAMAFTTELAAAFGCARVTLGFLRRHHIELAAVSHGAAETLSGGSFDAIAAAMDEAVQQAASIHLPADAGARSSIRVAHARLLQRQGGAVASVPLIHAGEIVGAVTCEWATRGDALAAQVGQIETAVSLVGPVLNLMRLRETPLRERAWSTIQHGWTRLRNLSDRRTQAGIVAAMAGVALLCALPMPYRVGGHARIEGAQQRALVAPTDGFLKVAHVRPGDRVKQGQVLVEMADQDLTLQRRKWASELAQQESAHAVAIARADRSALVVAMARADQARAQLALVDADIGRSNVVAPFDGVVIQGDLAQSVGSPLERGKPLLLIAPGDAFRVVIEVDERDIAEVRTDQKGTLALSALPWDALPITISRVTPIARAVDGNNVFDVVVQVSDGALTASQAFSVTVTPLDDNAPVITSGASVSTPENTSAVTTVTATDADLPAQSLSYAIAGGADAARFVIDAGTGALRFATAPDYEQPQDANADNVYDVLVSVSDGQHSSTQAIAVSVTPVDDNAPVIVSNGGGATAQIAVDASATAVTRVIATDADLPAPTLVYSIAGGADAARFTIDAQSGVLTFVAAPTGNSSFGVIVRASNGVQTTLQQLSIVVGPAKTNASPSVTIETAPPATTTAPAAPAAHEDPAAIAPAAKPTRSAPTTPDLTSTGGLGSFDAAGRDPLIGASGSFTPTVAMRIANALSIAVPSSTTLRNAAAELNSVVMTAQAAPVIGSAPSSGSRLEPESLAHALDEPANDSTTVLNSSVAVGLALSLGVVGWAARGVTLMASVLVSSPAWSGYDLLPVLRRRDEDADWGDDDNKEHDDSALPANDPKRSGRRDRSTPELIQ